MVSPASICKGLKILDFPRISIRGCTLKDGETSEFHNIARIVWFESASEPRFGLEILTYTKLQQWIR